MQKSKLILILKTLEASELILLERFLRSPFHNENAEILLLFQYLKVFHPSYPDTEVNKKMLFHTIYPNREFDGKQLRYLISYLYKLIEHFLVLQKLEKDSYQHNLYLLEDLSERGLVKSYNQVDRILEKELNIEFEGYQSDYYLTQFERSEIKELHFQKLRLRKYDPSIQIASDYLDKFYFLRRLIISCAMLDRGAIFQDAYQVNLSEDWIKHLESRHFFKEPIIQLYYNIYLALRDEEDESYFIQLKEFLLDNTEIAARGDLEDIYLFAINYCARKIRHGLVSYLPEALNLYRIGIEKKVLLKNDTISPWTFTNVVKLSLRLQQYEWVEIFIQEYAPKLPSGFKENALHYNLAELFYYTKRFEEAQHHLNQVAFSDLNYYLGARVLMAKIFYESNEIEPLLSLIASFTIFLKRNKKLSNNIKYPYLNFCQVLFQIIKKSPSQFKKLGEKIESTEFLTDRSWLRSIYESEI